MERLGRISLYNADCMDIMRELPDKAFDLAIVDPPYGVGGDSIHAGRVSNGAGKLKNRAIQKFSTAWDIAPTAEYFEELFRVSKNQIIWAKGGGGMGDLYGSYANNYEVIMFAAKGDHKLRGKREGCIWNVPKCKQEFHDTQKPVELIKKMILQSTDENMLVLDPFMGSGTTAIAAKMLGRHFAGCEINEAYVRIAERRLKNEIGLFL